MKLPMFSICTMQALRVFAWICDDDAATNLLEGDTIGGIDLLDGSGHQLVDEPASKDHTPMAQS